MGIAWLLLRRTFATRPKRTLLFLLGYALATGVMVTLLAVGEAVLLQAQDKDLLGGGDLILVPQGMDIESLKVGGVAAMYYTIPQARFLVRQLLGSSRFQNDIETISPYLFSRLLYVRKSGNDIPHAAFAEGSLPEQENQVRSNSMPWSNTIADREWLKPDSETFYHDIDHFHLPSSDTLNMSQWAEWHYFNFAGNGFYGYLSVMVAGDILHGNAKWIVSLQMNGTKPERYAAISPAAKQDLPLNRIDYSAGSSHVRFLRDHYEIQLDFKDKFPITGTVLYYPQKNLYFPPLQLAQSAGFESGYVIPSLRGTYGGKIRIGNMVYDLAGASGYHDHNWGIWQQSQSGPDKALPVTWNWGHAFSSEYALFFGEIFLQGKSKGLFAGVFDNSGFLTMFRPDKIEFSNIEKIGNDVEAPSRLQISQSRNYTAIDIQGTKQAAVATSTGPNGALYFVQYKMAFDVRLTIDGRTVSFPATGNAETFVNAKKAR